jgi:hypothetical protein
MSKAQLIAASLFFAWLFDIGVLSPCQSYRSCYHRQIGGILDVRQRSRKISVDVERMMMSPTSSKSGGSGKALQEL